MRKLTARPSLVYSDGTKKEISWPAAGGYLFLAGLWYLGLAAFAALLFAPFVWVAMP